MSKAALKSMLAMRAKLPESSALLMIDCIVSAAVAVLFWAYLQVIYDGNDKHSIPKIMPLLQWYHC